MEDFILSHRHMDKRLKNKFPKWCFSDKEFATILTDDIDSLVGCSIEKIVKGNKINYFYDFNKLYIADQDNKKSMLGVDLALHQGYCWDNHCIRINRDDYVNTLTANINAIRNIHSGNYFDKYAGSTSLMMWSFYDLPLPKTKLGKMLLLAIDSAFKGHYDNRFKKEHNKYLELMGFSELIDLLNQTQKQDYEKLIKQYKLNHKNGGKIYINKDGYLHTQLPLRELQRFFGIPLELPNQKFTKTHEWNSEYGNTYKIKSKDELGNIISFAMTGKNRFSYTR